MHLAFSASTLVCRPRAFRLTPVCTRGGNHRHRGVAQNSELTERRSCDLGPLPAASRPFPTRCTSKAHPRCCRCLSHRGNCYVYMSMVGASNVELGHKTAVAFPHTCLGKTEAAMGSAERKYVRESAEQSSRGTQLHRPPARLTFARGFRTIQVTTVGRRPF